jgi:hypothetical protein
VKKDTALAMAAMLSVAGMVVPDDRKRQEPEEEPFCVCGARMRIPTKPRKGVVAYCPKCGRILRK